MCATVSHLVVAVDGPAGSGKSSVSKAVAEKTGIKYIDSGALYRAITWYILKSHGEVKRGISYIEDLSSVRIRQDFLKGGRSLTYVDDMDVSMSIRDEIIARNIGIISDDPAIRGYVNSLLRDWGRNESIIMDGRDIGTVVFPTADLKIYLDASVEIRALRRQGEYREMGKTVDLNAIQNQIILRDREDQSRPVGCLKRADDAVYVDTTHLTRDEVIELISNLVRNKQGSIA